MFIYQIFMNIDNITNYQTYYNQQKNRARIHFILFHYVSDCKVLYISWS